METQSISESTNVLFRNDMTGTAFIWNSTVGTLITPYQPAARCAVRSAHTIKDGCELVLNISDRDSSKYIVQQYRLFDSSAELLQSFSVETSDRRDEITIVPHVDSQHLWICEAQRLEALVLHPKKLSLIDLSQPTTFEGNQSIHYGCEAKY